MVCAPHQGQVLALCPGAQEFFLRIPVGKQFARACIKAQMPRLAPALELFGVDGGTYQPVPGSALVLLSQSGRLQPIFIRAKCCLAVSHQMLHCFEFRLEKPDDADYRCRWRIVVHIKPRLLRCVQLLSIDPGECFSNLSGQSRGWLSRSGTRHIEALGK